MFTHRELATLLAALQFWSEEITPHPVQVAQPYLQTVGQKGVRPLTLREIRSLSRKLRKQLRS